MTLEEALAEELLRISPQSRLALLGYLTPLPRALLPATAGSTTMSERGGFGTLTSGAANADACGVAVAGEGWGDAAVAVTPMGDDTSVAVAHGWEEARIHTCLVGTWLRTGLWRARVNA